MNSIRGIGVEDGCTCTVKATMTNAVHLQMFSARLDYEVYAPEPGEALELHEEGD